MAASGKFATVNAFNYDWGGFLELDPVTSQTRKQPKSTNVVLGYAIGALGAAFFATKGIVIKLALIEGVGVVTTLTWRMIIAVPIFAIVGWLGFTDRKRKDPNFQISPVAALKAAGVGSIGYYLASYLDFAGLEFITAQLDRLILMTSPIFVVLISAAINKSALGLKTIAALLFSYIGLAVIFWQDLALDGANVITGSVLVLGAAFAYAIYQILAKPLIDEMGARLFTSIAMSAAGIIIMTQFSFTHQLSDLMVSEFAFILMLAIGTVSTVFPAYMIATSIGMIGPGPTAVVSNISPIVTIVLAITILGEAFSIYHALGATMVLLGIMAFTRFKAQS